MKPSVLFVCRHNTGRSQMAEAYLRHFAGDAVDVASAGTIAADLPDPGVVAIMAEDGIDISAARPKLLATQSTDGVDRIITMGCDVEGVPRIDDDWGLPDPKGQPPERVRKIRDEVKTKARRLANELLARKLSSPTLPNGRVVMESVLFVCIHNSARSQMAEAFVNNLCGERLRAESAGFEPRTLNPLAVEAMSEIGFDISANETKSVFDLFKTGRLYKYVVTVCDESSAEACPIFPGMVTRLHWSFTDPSTFTGTWDVRLALTRVVRDEIRYAVQRWCEEIANIPSEPCGAGAAVGAGQI